MSYDISTPGELDAERGERLKLWWAAQWVGLPKNFDGPTKVAAIGTLALTSSWWMKLSLKFRCCCENMDGTLGWRHSLAMIRV